MRRLLSLAVIAILTISISTCSDSGTGPDPGNDNDNNGGGEKTTYSVTVDVTPSDAGSISPSAEDTYDEGEEIELQANPNNGYVFTEWSGDIESTDNPYSLTVDQDYNITANFEIKSYELTINKEGEGSVNERIVQQKSTEYDHGTVVELTAEPQEGYEFVEWQGDLSGTENPSQITVDNPKEVTAVFEVGTYPLSIDVSGEGSITVTPDQEEYEYGTEVELLAEPSSSDWEFESWEGDTTSTNNPLTVSVDSSINITGKFNNTLFAGGAGTEENPYKISTMEQLQAINEYPSSHFVQINDIDASEATNWNGGKGFSPIGDDIVFFTGTFNGNEYTIKNLTINRPNDNSVGIFGYIQNAKIKNTVLESVNITGGSNVSSLIGYSEGNLEVNNSTVSGNITGNSNVGGLIGYIIDDGNGGSVISNNSSSVDVSGSNSVGGLIGKGAWDVNISDSNTSGEISGDNNIGGLIGYMNYGVEVHNSSSTGSVSAQYDNSGGLAGFNHLSEIYNSASSADVSGSNQVGGLVGDFEESSWSDPIIKNSSSSGNVLGDSNVGGLVGRNRGFISSSHSRSTVSGNENVGGFVGIISEGFCCSEGRIKNSYSVGDVKGDISVGGFIGVNTDNGKISFSFSTGKVEGSDDIGGFAGLNGATIESSYWDNQASNQSEAVGRGYDEGITGLNSSDMTGNSAESNMPEFDWSEIWVTTDNYPALFWE